MSSKKNPSQSEKFKNLVSKKRGARAAAFALSAFSFLTAARGEDVGLSEFHRWSPEKDFTDLNGSRYRPDLRPKSEFELISAADAVEELLKSGTVSMDSNGKLRFDGGLFEELRRRGVLKAATTEDSPIECEDLGGGGGGGTGGGRGGY